MRKDLKLADDPWENFLAYDSKHFLPLLNHTNPLPLPE